MMRAFRHLALGAIVAASAGCNEPFSARTELDLTVMEVRVPCVGLFEQPESCLSVVWPGQQAPQAFYDEIEGFTFQEGLRQRIRVARFTVKNPPADGSAYAYRLLEVIARAEIPVPAVIPLNGR